MAAQDEWLQSAANTVFRAAGTTARQKIQNDRDGSSLFSLVQQAQQYTDALVSQVVEQGPASYRPACHSDCAACCYLHVVVTPLEVLAIAASVRKEWNAERLGELDRRIHDHIDQTSGMDAAVRRQIRPPCPFLTGQRCDIYSIRPLSCRGWNSLDQRVCDSDFDNPTQGTSTPVNIHQYVLVQRVVEGLAAAGHSHGLESQSLDFVRGLKIALSDPEAAARSWRNGDPVFADARNDTVFAAPRDPEEEAARRELWNSL
jgi:hypothetical protein